MCSRQWLSKSGPERGKVTAIGQGTCRAIADTSSWTIQVLAKQSMPGGK